MATVHESKVVDDVWIVDPDEFGDERGVLVQTYRREWFPHGREMVQTNRTDRVAGSIVGLHYHLHMADYWYVVAGQARVVLHDLRVGAPTDGATAVFDLGQQNDGSFSHRGLFIPPGVAHGFAAHTDVVLLYMVDQYYNPADEHGVAWDDPTVNADWGLASTAPPLLSERDRNNPARSAIEPSARPHAGLRT